MHATPPMIPFIKRSDSPQGRFKHEFVAFFHPAYPHHTPPLLTLSASCTTHNGEAGVDYDTARVACGIIACNRWSDRDVYFAEKGEEQEQGGGSADRPGTIKWTLVSRPADGIIRAGFDYYFIVERPENRYPVVPCFDHWRFPHDALPSPWSLLPAPEVRERERSDVQGFHRTEVSLVPPFSHESWCESNQMGRYNQHNQTQDSRGDNAEAVDIKTQTAALHDDIDNAFTQNPVPMVHPRASLLTRRVEMHPTLNLEAITDRVRVLTRRHRPDAWPSGLAGLRREHLFARFALNVLSPENYKFLGGCGSYAVRLFDAGKGEQYTVELSDDEIVEKSSGIFPETFDDNYHRDQPATPESQRSSSSCSQDSRSWYSGDQHGENTYYEALDGRPRGRPEARSPEYFKYLHSSSSPPPEDKGKGSRRPEHESLWMEPMLDIPIPLQRPASISSLSLPSTVSVSSFEPLHAEKTTDRVVNGKYGSDTAAAAQPSQASLKRSASGDENSTDAVSRVPKRPRLG